MPPFIVSIRPRYSDVDGMGVVYHANYLVFFDIGRTEFFRAAGCDYARLERDGYRLVVVEARLRYLRPAHFDEELRLLVSISELGRASIGFDYVLTNAAGTALATGYTRLGCLDASRRPAGLPAATIACLRKGIPDDTSPSKGP